LRGGGRRKGTFRGALFNDETEREEIMALVTKQIFLGPENGVPCQEYVYVNMWDD
jgi:hypothetical protein